MNQLASINLTLDQLKAELASTESYIKYLEKDNRRLLSSTQGGVGPSWISTDIARNNHSIETYQAQADNLKKLIIERETN